MHGTIFVKLALFGAPLLIIAFFSMRRGKARPAETAAWVIMVSLMFLPSQVAFDPPLLPALNKHRLTFLMIAVCLRLFHANEVLKSAPGHNMPRYVWIVLGIGGIGTVLVNPEILIFGSGLFGTNIVVLPGLRPYDALALFIALGLDIYLPFSVGQRLYKTSQDLRDLFGVMVKCFVVYIPLMLLEIRISPQLHNMLYGFHPGMFGSAIRGNGYRAIVFMDNGLGVAMFVFACLSAGIGLGVSKARMGLLWFTMIAAKSFAPVAYAFAVTVVAPLKKPAISRFVIIGSIFVTVAFPALRAENLFPAKELVEFFAKINEARAASLGFRFDNEDILLDRANLKPWFGWGGYNRGMVFDEWGTNITITDGYWIILMGNYGRWGWACFFFLMIVPLVRYLKNRRRFPERDKRVMSALGLMTAIFMVDLLPNARFDNISVLCAGALYTLSETLTRRSAHVQADRSRKRKGRAQKPVGDPAQLPPPSTPPSPPAEVPQPHVAIAARRPA